jgi:hypothetical protein
METDILYQAIWCLVTPLVQRLICSMTPSTIAQIATRTKVKQLVLSRFKERYLNHLKRNTRHYSPTIPRANIIRYRRHNCQSVSFYRRAYFAINFSVRAFNPLPLLLIFHAKKDSTLFFCSISNARSTPSSR